MPYVDPALPLQDAIVAALKADPAVSAIVADRVYDFPPTGPNGPTKPYVTFGPFQMLPEHADCLDGGETFITLDAWAAGPSTAGVKLLGAAIVAALDEAELTLDGNRLVGLALEQTNYLREPDGLTTHASITMRALTDPV